MSLPPDSPMFQPDATFVLCVESGPLETQTVLCIESLRRWGGRFANCPILAITPRKGPPLGEDTVAAFSRMNVTWHAFESDHPADWYNPMNKPLALAYAEKVTDCDTIIWLDSDTLVIGDPWELELESGCDFTAMPGSYRFDIASDGSNKHEAFWQACLAHHGIDPARYPWIPAQPGETGYIRMYWQGGAFAYRRKTHLGQAHFDFSLRQIDARLASRHSGAYFTEQVGLALGVDRTRLAYRVLSASHNFTINALTGDQSVDASALSRARVVHYFGSMWPDEFDRFQACFLEARPDVAAWLGEKGPLSDCRPLPVRGLSKWKRVRRKRKATSYLASCKTF